MSNKQVEFQLDRSLQKQLGVPRLDGRFNAAVWQRIAAQSAPSAAVPRRRSAGSRWLMLSNFVGVGISLGLVAYVLLRSATGVQVDVELPAVPAALSLPELPGQTVAMLVKGMGWVLTLISVGLAFAFTSSGKRVLNAIRNF